MKSVFFAAVLSFGFIAGACPNPEAQFIATVASVTPFTQTGAVCQVRFSGIKIWNENALCPLDVEEAFAAPVLTSSCSLQAGDDASGVLVQQNDGSLSF
jgi:hypothetical protein